MIWSGVSSAGVAHDQAELRAWRNLIFAVHRLRGAEARWRRFGYAPADKVVADEACRRMVAAGDELERHQSREGGGSDRSGTC